MGPCSTPQSLGPNSSFESGGSLSHRPTKPSFYSMVDVAGICELTTSQYSPSYWPVVIVTLFSCFLSVDVGLTAYSLWKAVTVVELKN